MNPNHPRTPVWLRFIAATTCLAFFASCATAPQTGRGPEYAPTASIMHEARSASVPVETRAADYLQAASMTAPLLGSGSQEMPAVNTYNSACGELTVLLRSSEGGRLWNHPVTLTGNNSTYHLRLEPASHAVWTPNYFTSFELEQQIKEKLIRKENIHKGVGGALVGVRKVNPPEKFAPPRGITAAVTATLDFHGKDATLALRRPAKQPTATVEGKTRLLAANLSAPMSNHQPYVVVGHSMGGMLTHDQVVTVNEGMWDKALGQNARSFFKENSGNSLIVRATTFRANPRIKRVVFICTPHRGSDLASNGIGKIGISLITLPTRLATVMMDSLTSADLARITGSSKRLPNSITGLKPTSPALPVINNVPISVPYHSIIGDRGKGNSPNSSDGVVAYWSSHLDGAQSERIVPGPHGSCELPQTIAELDRILRLHLGIPGVSKTTVAQTAPR